MLKTKINGHQKKKIPVKVAMNFIAHTILTAHHQRVSNI